VEGLKATKRAIGKRSSRLSKSGEPDFEMEETFSGSGRRSIGMFWCTRKEKDLVDNGLGGLRI
jgi:hypothetical protein